MTGEEFDSSTGADRDRIAEDERAAIRRNHIAREGLEAAEDIERVASEWNLTGRVQTAYHGFMRAATMDRRRRNLVGLIGASIRLVEKLDERGRSR